MIAKFKESNNSRTDGCPNIINLWQETEKWKRSGYPDQDNTVETIFIIINCNTFLVILYNLWIEDLKIFHRQIKLNN